MVDVIADQLALGVRNSVFDSVKMLSEVQARLTRLDHVDN